MLPAVQCVSPPLPLCYCLQQVIYASFKTILKAAPLSLSFPSPEAALAFEGLIKPKCALNATDQLTHNFKFKCSNDPIVKARSCWPLRVTQIAEASKLCTQITFREGDHHRTLRRDGWTR